MKYNVIKRIQNGHKTIGYQLLSKNSKPLNISREEVIKLAQQGLLINATYDKYSKSLTGKHGADLRHLPVLQSSQLKSNMQTKVKSNHQLAQEYFAKRRLLGLDEDMQIEYLERDRILLIDVLDRWSTGKFTVPSFITDYFIEYNEDTVSYDGPFKNCRFTEIVINSNCTNWKGLFSSMCSYKLCIKYQGEAKISSLEYTFLNCENLVTLDINQIDTSEVVTMASMFKNCLSLVKLDLSNFNTSNVEDMHNMFEHCVSLAKLDISSFNTSKVQNMQEMFCYCESLYKLDINHFDTSKVRNMIMMFSMCERLKTLDLSGFNTSNVQYMQKMFYGCRGLLSLNVSSFNTRKVVDMYSMFYGCKKLLSLDLSSFEINENSNIFCMLSECSIGIKESKLKY